MRRLPVSPNYVTWSKNTCWSKTTKKQGNQQEQLGRQKLGGELITQALSNESWWQRETIWKGLFFERKYSLLVSRSMNSVCLSPQFVFCRLCIRPGSVSGKAVSGPVIGNTSCLGVLVLRVISAPHTTSLLPLPPVWPSRASICVMIQSVSIHAPNSHSRYGFLLSHRLAVSGLHWTSFCNGFTGCKGSHTPFSARLLYSLPVRSSYLLSSKGYHLLIGTATFIQYTLFT